MEITYGMSEGIVMRFYAMFLLREITIVINVMIIAILTTEDMTVDGTIVHRMTTDGMTIDGMTTDDMTTGGGISATMTTVVTTGIAITEMMIDIIEEGDINTCFYASFFVIIHISRLIF